MAEFIVGYGGFEDKALNMKFVAEFILGPKIEELQRQITDIEQIAKNAAEKNRIILPSEGLSMLKRMLKDKSKDKSKISGDKT